MGDRSTLCRRAARLALVAPLLCALAPRLAVGQAQPHAPRTVAWCGYEWAVKHSAGELAGPGPCVFDDSSSNVWIDKTGRLHLRIAKTQTGWRCAEVTCQRSLGYGTYEFAVDEVRNLDPVVIGGLFTWDDTSPNVANSEMDFEYGVWTKAGDPNFQAVVQPYTRPDHLLRYSVPLTRRLVHTIDWSPGRVVFRTVEPGARRGAPPLREWTYTGADVPEPGKEQVHLNLWLFRGQPPAGEAEPEMVLRSFRFKPRNAKAK